MPPKRTKKDKYDQWFLIVVPATTPGSNAELEVEISIPPTPSYYASPGKSTVLEVSEIEYFLSNWPETDITGTDVLNAAIYIRQRPGNYDASIPRVPDLDESSVWWLKAWQYTTHITVSGSTSFFSPINERELFTDVRGNGRLWVMDKLFAGYTYYGAQVASTMQWTARVWYRYTQIPLSEYIGIMQVFNM